MLRFLLPLHCKCMMYDVCICAVDRAFPSKVMKSKKDFVVLYLFCYSRWIYEKPFFISKSLKRKRSNFFYYVPQVHTTYIRCTLFLFSTPLLDIWPLWTSVWRTSNGPIELKLSNYKLYTVNSILMMGKPTRDKRFRNHLYIFRLL